MAASHSAAPVAMSFFARAPYKSEVSTFIDELKAKKPTLEAEQRAGRELLWDRAIDRQALDAWNRSRVPQQPYVYQTKTS
jgi:Protein of unknown function (DUF3460)